MLRVVSNAQLDAAEQAAAQQRVEAERKLSAETTTNLAGFIRTQFEIMRNHRDNATAGWTDRLISSLRAFNGTYDPQKLADIRRFGGSEVYARIVAMKCRGASSLLRDVYLAPERSWGLEPSDDPEIDANVVQTITQLVSMEAEKNAQAGVPVDAMAIRDRTMQLMMGARDAAKRRAHKQALIAEEKMEEILAEGGFYKALAEFIVDLPLFPFACIKGPTVKIVNTVTYKGGRAQIEAKPRLVWTRVSPFDLYWSPGVSDIEDASVIEKTRVSRADLNDLLDLPGYDHKAVRAVLDEYGRGGLFDNWDQADSERAELEKRENPHLNRSGMISCLEFHGNVQGRMLLEYGMSPKDVPDELRDYMVTAWLIGRHVIKAQISPSPRKRHPYFITSFEKMPGTPLGNGLPDILHDIAEVCNASLRALVNNLSISSGPQVVVHDDRLTPGEDGENLFPWKRWHVTSDPMGGNSSVKPVDFFQPNSNAAELLGVYKSFVDIADDLSAIPKYLAGGGAGSAAGRTASGLAMLMGNASKILQTVAANIDRDILEPLLTALYDMLMLTDTTGLLTGEESIRVKGVQVAVQKETQRTRQLEFLQVTANPIDAQIVGPRGRAAILRAVSETIGLDGQEIVPSDEQLEAMQKAAAAAAAQQGQPGFGGMGQPAAEAQGAQAPNGGMATGDMGPRTAIAGGVG